MTGNNHTTCLIDLYLIRRSSSLNIEVKLRIGLLRGYPIGSGSTTTCLNNLYTWVGRWIGIKGWDRTFCYLNYPSSEVCHILTTGTIGWTLHSELVVTCLKARYLIANCTCSTLYDISITYLNTWNWSCKWTRSSSTIEQFIYKGDILSSRSYSTGKLKATCSTSWSTSHYIIYLSWVYRMTCLKCCWIFRWVDHYRSTRHIIITILITQILHPYIICDRCCWEWRNCISYCNHLSMYICTCWRHRCSKGCTYWCCGQGISCTCGYSCTLSYLDLISIGSCKWCRYRRWGHKVWTTGDLQVKCGLVHSSIVTSHIRLLLSGKLELRICQALVSSRRRSACISNSSVTKTLFRSYFYLTLIKECWYIYLCC